MTDSYTEHPFAQFVRILGKGKNGSRHLTTEEAYDSFKMILANEVEPSQLGAFLMLMRVKEETGEELAGFIKAARESISMPDTLPQVELDWSSYAGKRRQLPWYILSALLLAENGIKIFMHGASGHTNGRVYTKNILPKLGIQPCTNMDEIAPAIESSNFAYMDIEHLLPKLHEIIELRPLLGLRSPVHTIARMLNPFNSSHVIQGIFHPGYKDIHRDAAACLKDANVAILKGEGGEIERNPDVACDVRYVLDGEISQIDWPAMFSKRHVKDDEMNIDRLVQLWEGRIEDEYGQAAVTGTAAIALHLLGKAESIEDAETQAQTMWNNRHKERFSAAA